MMFNFKKTLMIIVCLACFHTINAQQRERRTCDLTVTCTSPVSGDTVVNGNAVPFSFEITNSGPDKMITGDQIIYMLYLMEGSRQTIIHQDILAGYGNDSINFDEKIIYSGKGGAKVTINAPGRTTPFTLDLCVQIFSEVAQTNGDSLILAYRDPNSDNNTSCQSVTVIPKDGSTSIMTVNDENDFLIYPNPATDLLYIRIGEAHIKQQSILAIRDLAGRELYAKNLATSGVLSINLNSFPAGLYNISLQTDREVINRKFMVHAK